MSLGGQTVTFVTLTPSGVPDEMGVITSTPSNVAVTGCLHNPLSASETPEWLTDIGTQVWVTTAPPEAAAAAAKSTGQLIENGVTYRIVGGAQPNADFSGQINNVTIYSQIQED